MNELVRIQEFSDFDTKLAEFRDRYDNVVYDLEDPKQNRQARSDRFAIGKVVANLDRAHKELKAPLLEQVRLVDGERKRIKDDLLGIQNRIKSQIEEHEARIKAAEEAVQKRIDSISVLAEFDEWSVPATSGQIKQRIAVLLASNPEAVEYEPRQADAALAYRQTERTLTDMLAKRVTYEEEQAELERLRAEKEARERQEREDRIRREAEEKAKREAEELARKKAEEAKRREQAIRKEKERAEAAAKQAEERRKAEAEAATKREKDLKERAARDKADAEKRAQQAAKQAEKRAAQAERDKLLAEQRKREAAELKAKEEAERKARNKAHMAKVEAEAIEDIKDAMRTPQSVLEAIKAGKIRHVRIIY